MEIERGEKSRSLDRETIALLSRLHAEQSMLETPTKARPPFGSLSAPSFSLLLLYLETTRHELFADEGNGQNALVPASAKRIEKKSHVILTSFSVVPLNFSVQTSSLNTHTTNTAPSSSPPCATLSRSPWATPSLWERSHICRRNASLWPRARTFSTYPGATVHAAGFCVGTARA